MENFDTYVFSKQPGFYEPTMRKEFAKAIPLRTVVIYCYDPRAVGIPAAVARQFGEVSFQALADEPVQLQTFGIHPFAVVEHSDGGALVVEVGWKENCDALRPGVEGIGD